MYAVFQLSGFQYSAEEGDTLRIPLQTAKVGDKVDINDVMVINKGDDSVIGTPFIENAKIEAEVVDQGKDEKVMIYKYKRRTKYRRRQGHRQDFSEIKIKKIIAP